MGTRVQHAQVEQGQREGQNEGAGPLKNARFLLAEAFVHFGEQFAHPFLVVELQLGEFVASHQSVLL